MFRLKERSLKSREDGATEVDVDDLHSVTADLVRQLSRVSVPAHSQADGREHQWAYDADADLFYFCVSDNVWVRWTIVSSF